jgi:hypothetical protein
MMDKITQLKAAFVRATGQVPNTLLIDANLMHQLRKSNGNLPVEFALGMRIINCDDVVGMMPAITVKEVQIRQ